MVAREAPIELLSPPSTEDTLFPESWGMPFLSGMLVLTVTDGTTVDTFELVPYPRVSAEVIPFLRKTRPPLKLATGGPNFDTSRPRPYMPVRVHEGAVSEPGFQ